MTSVTVLAGERTIGGTQVVVEDQGARLLFDCGLPFSPAGDPFAYVHRRPGRSLADLIDLGLVPNIPDLYQPDLVSSVRTGNPPVLERTAGEVAVALSHSHLDHTHLAGCVTHEVPIYASDATARVVQLLSDTGASLGTLNRPLQTVPAGKSVRVGPMTLHLLPVDHDVCGACGLVIETTDGAIAYSGDLRLHGRHPEATLSFAEAAREAGARLLILEGTRLAPPAEEPAPPGYERTEAEVVPEVVRWLESAPGQLGVILLTPENGERVEALARAMGDIGRTLVLDQEGLTFAEAALGRPIAAPHAVFSPSDKAAAGLPTPPDGTPGVSAEDIAAQPGRFLVRIPFSDFAEVLDLLPAASGGLLFTSNGMPLGPFDPAWAHMQWWAERLKLQVVDASSTGHATPRDLALIAATSGAPTVIALHSHHPELMPVSPERLLLPERGRRYDLASLPVS